MQEFSSAGKLITKFGSAGSGSGEFSEPKGVAVSSSGGIYISDYGNDRVEEWTRPTWVPTLSEGPLKSGTTAYAYKPVAEESTTVIEPTEVLAPTPSGVTCVGEHEEVEARYLKKGCRALTFEYAETTKESIGEKESEWGTYAGRLAKVFLVAYNPAVGSEKMEEKAVAEYAYDSKGRLRAEWDPRLSPALKTTYGYDAEGHVVAVAPPGQEPWLLHYGTSTDDQTTTYYGRPAGDLSTGRLLSVIRPAPSSKETVEEQRTKLKEQHEMPAPVNTTAPTLSTSSPVIGTTLSVSSEGKWNNSPLTYSYLWEDCYTYESKEVCTPILGAVNQSYTPQARDAGYRLKAQVAAVNAEGTGVATVASNTVPMPSPSYRTSYGSKGTEGGKFSNPVGVARDPFSDNIWVTDYSNNRIEEFSSTGSFIEAVGFGVSNGNPEFEICTKETECKAGIPGSGNGQFNEPWGIAISSSDNNLSTIDNIYVTDAGNGRVEEFSSSGAFVRAFGSLRLGSRTAQRSPRDHHRCRR